MAKMREMGAIRSASSFSSSSFYYVLFGVLIFFLSSSWSEAWAETNKVTFEKMTNRDYAGTTYYTIRNVSLYECLGWCRDEIDCTSAAFSFIVNPLAPVQDTTCKLLNDTVSEKTVSLPPTTIGGGTKDHKPPPDEATVALQPQKASNLYFFNKLTLRTDSQCNRLWSFERYPNKMLQGLDNMVVYTSSKEACLGACQSERSFICRSVEFNYLTSQCQLSEFDRRSFSSGFPVELVDQQGVDYFENSCIESDDICQEQRAYDYVKVGVSLNKISYYVEINYYPDKELLVKSQTGCLKACSMESEFICRSILYRATYRQGQPNCALYHLDHYTLPDGLDTFLHQFNVPLPLFDTGDGSDAVYLEALCTNASLHTASTASGQQLGSSSLTQAAASSHSMLTLATTSSPTKLHNSYTKQPLSLSSQHLSSSTGSTGIPNQASTLLNGQLLSPSEKTASKLPSLPSSHHHSTHSPYSISSTVGGSLYGNKVHPQPSQIIAHERPLSPAAAISSGAIKGPSTPPNITIGTTTDPSCDSYGVCYQVSLRCTDSRILVQVRTSQPFHGRIYALGRSETCNNKIHNAQHFSLEMSLTGQDCNTQSVQGVYSNTVVLQHHNVVLTKADKVYHVRCTYETASRNVSFGMVPVRDATLGTGFGAEPVEVSASPEAPLPRIVIESGEGREASTVRVGDKLTFRIAIPDNTPYGIFARSCVAMAKDARSTFEIIDQHGCPVDHSIFPAFQLNGNALESTYEAFRFTESYGVIFQCNVKYCVGRCEPILCPNGLNQTTFGRESHVESYGRRRRREASSSSKNRRGRPDGSKRRHPSPNDQDSQENGMTLSHEIMVLDLNDPDPLRGNDAQDGMQQPNSKQLVFDMDHCASTSSLLALCILSALLLILYVCTVAYFTAQQRQRTPCNGKCMY